ncbi:unnamed protein product [Notodromas monacha]|uniref:Uncharacterized protein n=1 Tax=Notodromas monacha TaxID=399045 RepID=A0A7R9C088_9CRUS|nr:unnamed protein product [Notodromas monacha]CAG0924089.1 unnamed protein product [Notodromas monacha]
MAQEIRASVASNNKQQQRSSSTRSSANARHAEGHKYPRRRSTPCDTVVRVDNDGTSFKCSEPVQTALQKIKLYVVYETVRAGRAVARGRQKPRASSLDAAIYSTTAAAGIPLLRDSYAQSALRKHSLPASIYDDHGALLAAAMTDPGAGSLFHHNEHGDEAGPVVPHPGAASVGSSGRPVKHVRLSVPNEGSVCGAGGRRNSARSRRRRAVGTQDYKSCALVQTRLKLGDIMLDNLSGDTEQVLRVVNCGDLFVRRLWNIFDDVLFDDVFSGFQRGL